MRTIIRLSLLLATLIVTPAGAQQTSHFPSDSAVLAIITQRVKEGRSAGIVVGLLEPDGRTRVVAYGDPGPGKLPLDGNSVFEIGSITKVFTATILADMVQKGEVKLDDPVQMYLPAGVKMPMRNGKQITLANLSEQNSGLPRMPSNFKPRDSENPFADYTVAQMYEFVSAYELPRDPGEKYEYSNLGVGLLGHVLALRAHMSYEDLVRTRVLKPLGMTHTSITLTPWQQTHLALGHNDTGAVVANWDIPSLAGAGALRSTTLDMLSFLAANLHTERKPLGAAMAFAQKERAPVGGPMAIGLNWHILKAQDTIVWHNGGTGGYRTYAGIIPRKHIGVVVLTNTGGQGGDDIALHLLNPSAPLTPAPRKHTAIELAADVLERYVGRYEFVPTFAMDVTRDSTTLWGQATGQGKVRLWPETETDFFIKEVDAQITFVRDASGVVTGMVLHQNGQNPPARKVN